MAIKRDIVVRVSDTSSSLDSNLILYEKDKGLEIYFNLIDNRYIFSNEQRSVLTGNECYYSITIVDPQGYEIYRDKLLIVDKKCKLVITEDLTEEMVDVGIYNLQIHIHEGSLGNQFSIPPFTFEVRKRLKGRKDIGRVNEGEINKSTVDIANESIPGSENGEYTKTNWQPGDIITDVRLNNIEDGVKNAHNRASNMDIDNMINEIFPK